MAKKQVSPMVEEYERSMRSFDAQPKWLQEASLRYMRSIPHLKRSEIEDRNRVRRFHSEIIDTYPCPFCKAEIGYVCLRRDGKLVAPFEGVHGSRIPIYAEDD